jgi:serine/threonine-protein kinase
MAELTAPVRCARCETVFDPTLGLRFCGKCGAELPLGDAITLPPDDNDADPLLGRILDGRYKILELIGQGGMGKVYLVEHQQMGKRMAMKVLHRELANNKDVNRRFRREALAVSRLTSMHTVQVFDFGQGSQGMYLVMELLRGEDVGRLLEREGRLPLPRVVDLLCQTATALEEAHAQGIIHRDLKPENLFLSPSPQGSGELLKVLDFGLAKLQSGANEETGHGRIVGTPYYMAPEQIRGGEVDARTDIYALGALFYKLLTGDPPYRADNPFSVLSKHVSDPIPKLRDKVSGLPREADALLESFLAKEPNRRPRDVREVRRRLRALLHEPSSEHEMLAPALLDTAPSLSTVAVPVDAEGSWATRQDWEQFATLQRRKRRAGWLVVPLLLGGLALAGYQFGVFSALSGPAPDPQGGDPEPNNDYKTALKLVPGQVSRGFLGKRIDQDTPDRDLYKIDFGSAAPRFVEAEISGIPNINVRLDFYLTEGGTAKRLDPIGDNEGRGGGEVLGLNTNERVLYLAVRQVKLGAEVVENVSDLYELRVKTEAPREAPATPPDPFLAPKRLNADQNLIGYASANFVQDVYRLTTPGKRLSVRLDPLAGIDAVLEVYNAERQLIASADKNSLSQGEALDSIALPEGEPPFIVVRKKAGGSEGVEYTLSAAVK